jgi:hypothetical protein
MKNPVAFVVTLLIDRPYAGRQAGRDTDLCDDQSHNLLGGGIHIKVTSFSDSPLLPQITSFTKQIRTIP